jgi:hypothetical protein
VLTLVSGPTSAIEPPPKANKDEQGMPMCRLRFLDECLLEVCLFELVRHGYPWVPTDQAHGRPRQVGLAYQKTRRHVSGPN